MENINTEMFLALCRICTKLCESSVNLFNIKTDLEFSVTEAVMECSSIHVRENDGLPTQICSPCIANLSIAYNFRLLCINSNVFLQELYETIQQQNIADQKSYLDNPTLDIDIKSDVEIKSDIEIKSDNEIKLDETTIETPTPRPRKKIKRRKKEPGGPPNCKQCQMTFCSHTNLLRHLSTHNGEKRHKCQVCHKQFATAAYVKSHMVVHSKERKFVCNDCGKKFMFSSDLTIHMRKHTGERPYVCETCAKDFVSSSALNAHRFKHGPKRFFCCVCNKGFIYKLELNSHIAIHKKDQFIIVEQVEPVEIVNDLETTLMKKDRDPIQITKENLHKFQSQIDSAIKHQYQCDVCSKVLSSLSNLYRHKLIHSSEKPHICDICDKGFKLKIDLVNHKNRHLGIRNISCEYCPKMFASRSDYGKHVSTHLSYKPYSCDECSKTYYNVYALNYHKKQHNLQFKCTIEGCSKSYDAENKLEKHLKLHDESKQRYKCEVCDKVLSNMNSLGRHIKKVHTIKNNTVDNE